MPAVRVSKNQKLVRGLGLMASASIMSLIMAGEAQASCVAVNSQPLNAITASTTVNCTGTNTGQTITANASSVSVIAAAGGATIDNSTITLNGSSNGVSIDSLASSTDLTVAINGTSGALVIGSPTVTNLAASLNGDASLFEIASAGRVTTDPGNIVMAGTANGPASNFNLDGTLTGTASNGSYLIAGGVGSQIFNLNAGSRLEVQNDGLAINGGSGDDTFNFRDGSTIITAASSALFDGGSGTGDVANILGSGIAHYSTANVETINVDPGSGGYRQLRVSNADATQVNIVSGDVEALHPDALGAAQSTVDIATATRLFVRYTAPGNFNHVLSGGGFIQLNGLGNTITVGGADGGFTGTAVVVTGTTAHITNGGAFGSGTIDNFGTVSLGGVILDNTITGSGNLIKNSPGTSTLTGSSSYSGGTSVQSGTLQITNVAAVSTGPVNVSTGATFQFGGTGSFTFANSITGAGMVLKTGTGTTTLTGANTYSGGTSINAGTMQVFDLSALGTGLTTVDAGATLLLNYSGAPVRQSNQFLVGGGSFIKDGSGELIVDGSNYYFGGTNIVGGAIRVTTQDALGTEGIQIGGNAALILGDSNAGPTVSNNISGNGVILVDQVTGVVLDGNNSAFQGTINIASPGSYIYVERGESLGSGSVQIAQGSSLEIGAPADTTVSAALSGGGDLNLVGSSRVGLTNVNSLSGTVNVMSGTLAIAGTDNVGSNALIDLSTGALLELSTSANKVLSNNIVGAGRVTKTGLGNVSLTGNNSYTGGTDIRQGAIRVTDVSFLGAGPITVQSGGALDLSIAGAQTLNQNVTGAGILRKSNTGDLTLLSNGLTGGVDVVGGRVIVSTVGALGGGGVSLGADTQLVFSNSATEMMSNVISGAGALTKDGPGLLVIQNANTYTGGTIINSGRLGLNNGQGLGTGNVIVLSGSILGIGNVSVANNVSGAGQIIKTASGVGMLTGTNTHSGGTDIQGGTLFVNSPAALGSGTVAMGTGTTLNINYTGSTNVALNNVLTGAGALVKDGSGTLVINNGTNNYSGGTNINAGRLGLNFGNGLGTGNVVIGSGASLALGDVTYGNATSGAGQIVKTSAGLTTLTGTNTHSGGLAIQGGTLAVSGNAPLGTGTVAVSSGAVFEYTNANAATFSNGLSGAGSFNKLGSGQLTFANNFTIGSLNLNAGRTRINTIATSNVAVAANATLDGTGRIIGNLTNNGTVAPGNSIGTLTVQGNYTQNANSVLEIEFDGAGNIDLLDVTGNATLNGGTLRFVSIGGAEGQGGTFLRTGGTLTGTFSTVETVGALLPLAVVYEPNRAFMAPSVLTARPSTFNAQSMAAADTALGFVDSIGVGDVRHGSGNRLWLSGFGAWGKRSASGSTLAYDHDTHGMAGGANFDLGGSVTLGAAIGWSKGDITLGGNGGGGDQSSVLGSLTARYTGSGLTFGGGLLYGKVKQDTLRNVSFNGFSGSVSGETDSKMFGGFAELGLPLGSTGGWAFSANARGSYIRQSQDGYTESGTSPLRLTLGGLKTRTLEGQAKLTAKTRLWGEGDHSDNGAGGLDLRVELGGRYLGTLGDRKIPVTFAVSNAGIVLQGDTRNTMQGLFGAALDYTTRSSVTFSLGYKGEVGKSDRHAIEAGVSFAF